VYLSFDPGDADITAGATQFILPYVAPGDILSDEHSPGTKFASADDAKPDPAEDHDKFELSGRFVWRKSKRERNLSKHNLDFAWKRHSSRNNSAMTNSDGMTSFGFASK
jgi:hypothetical protein